MVGFGTEQKTKHAPSDLVHAQLLIDILKKARQLSTTPQPAVWAEQFRLLRKEHKATENEVGLVLAWWVNNRTGQYTPSAYHAKTFRQKYPRIKEAMERAVPKLSAEPSPAAVQLSTELKLRWPLPSKHKEHFSEATKKQEPAFIEMVLVNYDAWRNAVIAARNNALPDGLEHRLLNHIISSLGDRLHFAEMYVRHVHSVAWRWPAWRGTLSTWVWRPTDKHYTKALAATVGEFCGTARSLPWLFTLCGIKWEGVLPSGTDTDDF